MTMATAALAIGVLMLAGLPLSEAAWEGASGMCRKRLLVLKP